MTNDLSKGKVIIYSNADGIDNLEVVKQDDTLWLSAERLVKKTLLHPTVKMISCW